MIKQPDVQGEICTKSGEKTTKDELMSLWLNLTEEGKDIVLKYLEIVSQNRKQADIICDLLLKDQIEEGIEMIISTDVNEHNWTSHPEQV